MFTTTLTLLAGLMFAMDPPLATEAPPPQCQEWSDGCKVCTKTAEGAPACSTPGIACQPGPVVCRTPANER
jgi:hypothetical protein